ncbi:motility-associated protein Scm1 [Spiroplasma taiwanense]|uniref:Motility-associated protein Scm1 n=1 Tax=Spiroplasma taiwanense CT-1 TaxID=1276220 RepID=S5MH00_9MOLU|nr:motility-associated protein Scm1 [Spiroplasma taiwanense]AGR41125.1 hypothetical protein STAIW_v1c04830 [Spiroplasma taiwanense CT-1]
MKNKNIFITNIILAILIIITLIVTLVQLLSIDVSKELNIWSCKLNDFSKKLETNISNPIDLAYFLFGFIGFSELIAHNSISMILFAIGWVVFLPILFILFSFFLTTYITLFCVKRIRREMDYKTVKTAGKWGMYASFLSSILFSLIALLLVSFLEPSFNKSQLSSNLQLTKNYDAFSIITLLTYLTNSTIFGAASNDFLEFLGQNFNLPLFITTVIFLVIFLPINGLALVFFSSMWVSTFITDRGGTHSKFWLWLKNIRIDSKREYYGLVFKNIWLWLLVVSFFITILMPGLIHPYENLTQILIAVFFIIIAPLVFLPIMVGIYMAAKIKRFNYNLLMFVQILVLLFTVLALQINIWIFLKADINVSTTISCLVPLITISLAMFGFFGFIKFQKR